MEEILQRVNSLRTERRFNCAQIVATMLMEDAGEDPTFLANTMRGFGSGLNCGKLCGCLAGGAAGLNALVKTEGVEGKRTCGLLNKQMVTWFEDKYASTECDVLTHPADGSAPVPCPVLMAETYAWCAQNSPRG